MKKNLLGWFAMATMLVGSGCSSDEVVNDYSPENAIQFGTYVGRGAEGRANVITSETLGTNGFGVFAYYTKGDDFSNTTHKPNFMYNQRVENTSTWNSVSKKFAEDWEYTPIKYWPNNKNDKVSFFAYAPHSETTNSNVTVASATDVAGYPQVDFTVVNSEIKFQSDLLWAEPIYNISKNSSDPVGINDKVTFTFKHALSRIAFEVQTMIDKVNDDKDGDDDDDTTGNGEDLDLSTKVIVKEVTLTGEFYKKGILTWNGSSAAITGSDPASTTFTLGTSHFNNPETINWGTKATQYTGTGKSVNQTEAQLNAEDSYIMVVPQNFTDENLTITVKYDVVTADDNLHSGYSEVNNEITTTFKGVNFQANHAYKFSLHLGLTTVKLEASVNDWEDGTDYSVNVPINTSTTTP